LYPAPFEILLKERDRSEQAVKMGGHMEVQKNSERMAQGIIVAVCFGFFIAVTFAIPALTFGAIQEVCVDCHEEVAAAFESSFHARAWRGSGNVGNGCHSCHGSADVHQEDPSKETIITFGKDSVQSAEEQSGRCLACHKKWTNLTFWDMGAHKKNDVACVSCHKIHQPRHTVDQPTVCFGCHRDVRSDANKMSHHPIIEGKVKCSDCHNTHGTLSKNMIRAENINQLCYKCHADKRGPWIWEHPPVEENCTICHTPHGSRHDNLLVERTFTLCEDCHSQHVPLDNTAGFQNDGTANWFAVGRACVQCHHAIHGTSNFRESFTR
jgi:DmsE family decaheme c-type cytochrome